MSVKRSCIYLNNHRPGETFHIVNSQPAYWQGTSNVFAHLVVNSASFRGAMAKNLLQVAQSSPDNALYPLTAVTN